MMKLLSVDKLEPGMEVARDAVNLNGAVLLAAGTLLSSQHLRMLQMWGIDAIHITLSDTEETRDAALAEITPAHREAAEAYVRHRFRHVRAEAAPLKALFEMAILRAAARLAAAPQESLPQPTGQ